MSENLKVVVDESNAWMLDQATGKTAVADDELEAGKQYVVLVYAGQEVNGHCVATFDKYLSDPRFTKQIMSFDFTTGKGEHNFQVVQDGATMIYPYEDEFGKDTALLWAFNFKMYSLFTGKSARGQA